jgi:hypothetical protein
MLTRKIMTEMMSHLNKGSHWGPQALCDVILRKYICVRIYTIPNQVTESFLTCGKVSKQASRQHLQGGRSPGLRPFQSVQVDIPKCPR